MNALAQMASTLGDTSATGATRLSKPPSSAPSSRPGSHARAMLDALIEAKGAQIGSRTLAQIAGVEVKQVLGILKHSIAVGRVDYRVDEHRVGWYAIREDFDAELHKRLNEAASLLRRHGWRVSQR